MFMWIFVLACPATVRSDRSNGQKTFEYHNFGPNNPWVLRAKGQRTSEIQWWKTAFEKVDPNRFPFGFHPNCGCHFVLKGLTSESQWNGNYSIYVDVHFWSFSKGLWKDFGGFMWTELPACHWNFFNFSLSGCFLKWWYPQSPHTKCWSFLVGTPMVVGETHHFRSCPHIYKISPVRHWSILIGSWTSWMDEMKTPHPFHLWPQATTICWITSSFGGDASSCVQQNVLGKPWGMKHPKC